MTDAMTSQNIDLPSRNRAGGKDNSGRPSQTTKWRYLGNRSE
jgi:hypothetical protein